MRLSEIGARGGWDTYRLWLTTACEVLLGAPVRYCGKAGIDARTCFCGRWCCHLHALSCTECHGVFCQACRIQGCNGRLCHHCWRLRIQPRCIVCQTSVCRGQTSADGASDCDRCGDCSVCGGVACGGIGMVGLNVVVPCMRPCVLCLVNVCQTCAFLDGTDEGFYCPRCLDVEPS
jgi:hypothetical protein